MFNKLSIKNFRGIEKLDIENFNRINIFVGENGIGKTSILDAIYVSINPNNALLSFKTNLFRRIDDAVNNPNFWRTFFYKFSEKNKISISLSNKSKDNKRKIEIKPVYSAQKLTLQPQENKQNDFFSTSPTIEEETILGLNYECTIGDKKITSDITQKDSNSFQSKADENYQENLNGSYLNNHTFLDNDNIASKLSNLIDRKRKNELLDLLKKFKLSISDIVLDKNRKIKIDDNGFSELVYAHTYGDGFVRALHIICNFMANDSDVVLIDELENGLHVFSQKYVWESVLNLLETQNNTQLFATTHSIEMIKNLYEVFKENNKENLLSVYRMQKDENNVLKVIHYNSEDLQYVIEQDQEIR
ncbi:AAA family ATPase [bacterium]|jgi:AAA15 family ATPase/GTPase|nr:AAA family ATPase [bacterium]MBT3581406.1 AAA family ATPase [bacterium]MBT4552554.1 AAA family ATPase [bacterium]MBT5989019.1 AAA family ATPase [bacterium]MBT7087367.1 AAA family ATPase [bacterium]